MDSISVKLSISEILSIANKLPKEMKLFLVKKWAKELQTEEATTPLDLSLEGFDQPFDLDAAAFSKKELLPLQKLWKDELPAEDLVKMLTS
jgi:hypothetical protein